VSAKAVRWAIRQNVGGATYRQTKPNGARTRDLVELHLTVTVSVRYATPKRSPHGYRDPGNGS
jgi:hypothetical protein